MESKKEKLVALGAEKLANLLIEIAVENEFADNKLQRVISNQSENVKNFREKLRFYKKIAEGMFHGNIRQPSLERFLTFWMTLKKAQSVLKRACSW